MENITSNKFHECIIMHEKEGEAAWIHFVVKKIEWRIIGYWRDWGCS